MAIVFEHDFEDNSLATWDTNDGSVSPTIQTSIVYEGSRALRSNLTAQSARLIKNITATPTATHSARVRRATSAAETLIFQSLHNTSFSRSVYMQGWTGGNTVRVVARGSGGDISLGVVSGLLLDAWEEWQLAVDATTNPWVIRVWRDGTLVMDTTFAEAAFNIERATIGAWVYSTTWDIYHDKVRIANTAGYLPTAGAFPTTGILDSFNRADENPVATNWSSQIFDPTFDFNGLKLASNALTVGFAGDNASSWYDLSTFGPDQEAYCTIVQSAFNGDEWRLVLRAVNPGVSSLTCYDVRYQSFDDQIYMYRWDDWNSPTYMANVGETFAAGDKFGASVVGNTIKAYKYTGGAWAEKLSTIDTTYTTAGYIGLRMGSGDVTTLPIADDFGGGTVAIPTGKQSFYSARRRSWR